MRPLLVLLALVAAPSAFAAADVVGDPVTVWSVGDRDRACSSRPPSPFAAAAPGSFIRHRSEGAVTFFELDTGPSLQCDGLDLAWESAFVAWRPGFQAAPVSAACGASGEMWGHAGDHISVHVELTLPPTCSTAWGPSTTLRFEVQPILQGTRACAPVSAFVSPCAG